jgi:hypothetical protein
MPSSFIKVQFYKSHIIVAALANRSLQIMQSFPYSTPADVLYNLLNICRQFDLKGALLQVSGMIENDSSMLEELNKYFRNIVIEDSTVPELEISNHPSHYFTPFFKLHQ